MLTGKSIGYLVIGQKIGEGAFGEIYVVRNQQDSRMYALKVEPLSCGRKILNVEITVLKAVSPDANFPAFIGAGETQTHTWIAMELLGPSLSSVLKRLPKFKLSKSSGLRVLTLILNAIERLHKSGFIHRDVKPSNILLRRSREHPIAMIDFGLSRPYVNPRTGKHLPQRRNPGFRGTTLFASPNAQGHQDLSRRDDLISWYYLGVDCLSGSLPWRHLESKTEILHMKRCLEIGNLGREAVSQFGEIWEMISGLEYEDEPPYSAIRSQLELAMEENGVKFEDEWDWHPQILFMGGDEPFDHVREVEREIEIEAISDLSFHEVSLNSEPLLKRESPAPCCRICSVQ
jgi:serine/threonine protein kinase